MMTSSNDFIFKSVLRTIVDKEDVFVIIVPEKAVGEDGNRVWLSSGNSVVRAKGIDEGDSEALADLLMNCAKAIK